MRARASSRLSFIASTLALSCLNRISLALWRSLISLRMATRRSSLLSTAKACSRALWIRRQRLRWTKFCWLLFERLIQGPMLQNIFSTLLLCVTLTHRESRDVCLWLSCWPTSHQRRWKKMFCSIPSPIQYYFHKGWHFAKLAGDSIFILAML